MGSIHEVMEAFRSGPVELQTGHQVREADGPLLRLGPLLSEQYAEVCRWIDWRPDQTSATAADEKPTSSLLNGTN